MMGGLYNMINGVNPATWLILPMLGKHPDEYPRFRDCFVTEDDKIEIFTRVGGGNRNCGFGEEELMQDPNFVRTFDDEFDSTYGSYIFNVPEEWKEEFDRIVNKHEKPSPKYLDQMCKVYPKLADKFREVFGSENT